MAAALPFIMIGMSLLSSSQQAQGQQQTAEAQAQAAAYNAAVDQGNAQIARQKATWASQAGEAQAGASEEKTRAQVGSIKANQAASGVDVNTGSAVDVRASQAALGMQDALTIRSNAAREAYGYETEARSSEAAAGLGMQESAADTQAGALAANSTLLGGVGNAADQYYKFQQSGAFNSSSLS